MSVLNGRYKLIGNIDDSDCVIAQSFGRRELEGGLALDPINCRLGAKATEFSLGRPVIAQIEIAQTIPKDIDLTVISKHREEGKYLDTLEVLEQTAEIMSAKGLERPIIIAHAFHIGRVAAQARKIGLDPIVLEGMPGEWDSKSAQIWTQNRLYWMVHEILGYPVLKLRNKL